MDQHCIDGHADQDQKALKSQRKQRFQIVLSDMALLMIAPCCHGHRCQTDHHINLDHAPVHQHKNNDAEDPHGDSNEEGLQEQPEQRADLHLHHAGFQHRKPNFVDTGIARDDAAGICYNLLCYIEHRHNDLERVADEPD